ncbi:odorant receptor 85b-like [Hermetia illucens]|uniref:odorant receptor 85b-like n=1 Tax=Hermetia illucens TaxID=343691 RepID=UPI0018CBFCDD|nr:odorant receptor 85b-like [Hermetia illucens]
MSSTVNEVFGVSIVLNLVAASFNLCLLGFRITSGVDSFEFLSSILLLIFQMAQIACACYLGTQLIESSLNINNSVYNIYPYCEDIGWQRSLLFIMKRSQTPAVLNSPMLSSISMETMRRVVGVAFQFFAVLNSVRQRG